LLQVSLVVIEWSIIAHTLKHASILDHLGVELINVFMRHDTFNHHKTILVDVSHRFF
jgi:hypothetical protein